MTKSSAILFILLFSLLFKLEEMRVTLLLVVLLIAGGLFMFTYKSTQFNAQGFVLVLCASFLGGIRWTLTQILMQKAELGLQNPIDIMFHLQPLMFLGLFPLFAVFEGLPLSISEKLFRFHEAGMLFSLVGKLFLGGILAFGLGFSEFLLVSRTSSLTLSIAGIFKEICILFLATHLLGDRLSLLNWLGFAVCLLGISLHVVLKAMNSKGDKALEPHKETSSDPDLELLLHHPEHEQMLGFLLKFQYRKHPEGKEKVSLQTPLHSSGPLPSKQGEDFLFQSLSPLSLWDWDLLCPLDHSGEPAMQGYSLLKEGQGN
ncbi:hypothetical protein IHE44_0004537 [Lamprotornis superbus]|uniref:Solute carrier family 35 member C2 n=1 Tax=Lamprotornis superbus TaxID=245042 RepID=A0A835TYW2_9PASS|nr:hypothetical protein IHE44_0004537 [Lamprotornis superbus]